MADKLNSMRILDQHKIDYVVHEFPETIHSADGVADYVGRSREMVYKTLVVLPARGKPADKTQGRPMLVMVAGNRELNLKKLAKAVGLKKVQMAPHREAEELTGLQTGGISALALLHKNFDVYIDRPALELDRILVSAGQRGINLELPRQALMRLTKAKAVDATG